MKPNDKAIEAALAEGKKWDGSDFTGWKVLRQDDIQDGWDIIAEFANREERDEALERLRAEAMIKAAYAAQFQSEDYAGLVKELRAECRDWLTADCVEKAADAIEAVLANRDALEAELEKAQDIARVQAERIGGYIKTIEDRDAERDALAARLAPVEDDALVEIAVQAGYKAEYEADMSVGQAEPIFVEAIYKPLSIYKPIMIAAIAAIRPHIEAAERERCAKELTEACELLHRLTAIIPGNDGAGEQVAKFLRSTAIRRGD